MTDKTDKNIKITIGGCNSFCGLLTILFIGLKLTHHIDWGWGWVLCPLWIPIIFTLGIIALCFCFVAVGTLIVFSYNLCFKKPKGRVF